MTDGDIITGAREACDAWRDATDLVRYRFGVAWEIEQVVDARGKLWGVVEGVVYLAAKLWTRMESLARMGMATRDGVTILRSTAGDVVTALSTHMRDDGRIAQRLDADELWLAIDHAEGRGEDPEAYEVYP